MKAAVFEGSLEQLSMRLTEVQFRTIAGSQQGQLACPTFWPDDGNAARILPSEPTQAEWKAGLLNFIRIVDEWRILLTAQAWGQVHGAFPKITFRLLRDEVESARIIAEREAREGRFEVALDSLAESLRYAESLLEDHIRHLLAAIAVAEESGKPRLSANDAMIATLEANHEAAEWTVEQFAAKLGFAGSTIHATPMWKKLTKLREGERVDRTVRDAKRTGRKRKSEPDK